MTRTGKMHEDLDNASEPPIDLIDISMYGEYGTAEDIRNVFVYRKAALRGKVNIHLGFNGDSKQWTLRAEEYPAGRRTVKMADPWPLTERQKAGVDLRIILVEQSTMILKNEDGHAILEWIGSVYEAYGEMSFRDCLLKVRAGHDRRTGPDGRPAGTVSREAEKAIATLRRMVRESNLDYLVPSVATPEDWFSNRLVRKKLQGLTAEERMERADRMRIRIWGDLDAMRRYCRENPE